MNPKNDLLLIREIVKEELQKTLRERRDEAAYWIDPSGNKHKVEGLHIEWIMDNRNKFDSIPDDFDTRDVKDPDYSQRFFISQGWINLSVFKESVSIRGTKASVRENLSKLVFDNPNYVYTVVFYDKNGEPVDEYLSLDSDTFIKKVRNSSIKREPN